MSEATRRNEVKKFRHANSQFRWRMPEQRSLFDGALYDPKRTWNCAGLSAVRVAVGQSVTVEYREESGLAINWGNENVGIIRDIAAIDLMTAMSLSNETKVPIPAVVIGADPESLGFQIRLWTC